MRFGQSKCVFLHIAKGSKKKSLPLNINHLKIQPVSDGDSYKYLCIDKNITCNGPLNKEKVSIEYEKYGLQNCLISTNLLHTTASQYLHNPNYWDN